MPRSRLLGVISHQLAPGGVEGPKVAEAESKYSFSSLTKVCSQTCLRHVHRMRYSQNNSSQICWECLPAVTVRSSSYDSLGLIVCKFSDRAEGGFLARSNLALFFLQRRSSAR
jgi:hypothetical protein